MSSALGYAGLRAQKIRLESGADYVTLGYGCEASYTSEIIDLKYNLIRYEQPLRFNGCQEDNQFYKVTSVTLKESC